MQLITTDFLPVQPIPQNHIRSTSALAYLSGPNILSAETTYIFFYFNTTDLMTGFASVPIQFSSPFRYSNRRYSICMTT